MEAKILLKDPDIFPSETVLKEALGDNIYAVLKSFTETITSPDYGLIVDWRYYNDGKAWLSKTAFKKKTILWLSAWEGSFKTSFFFTEKHLEGIAALPIAEAIKDEFAAAKPVGRLIPLIINVTRQEQLDDLLTIIRFKKSLK